jgi:glycosyltransferase involved in cell wall biosynthesis
VRLASDLCHAPVADALRALIDTPSITRALRLSEDLGHAAALSPDPAGVADLLDRVITDGLEQGDALTALGAIHAIGRVADDQADGTLVRLVHDGDRSIAGHAAWVLGGRIPELGVVGALIAQVMAGGFEAMLAQRTLVQWSAWAGPPIAAQIRQRLTAIDTDLAAALRLVDTLDAAARGRRPIEPMRPTPPGTPITVIQPFLHARLDATGSRLGAGDAGGIASLLRSLGTDLAHQRAIAEVVTVTRAHPTATSWEANDEQLAPGHRLARVRYGEPVDIALADAWEHRVAIERELTRLVATLAGPVVWHVRMADVGTLAATAVARQLGHHVVFTVAPDPHAVIAVHQRDGQLGRASFGAADAAEHLWFRARLVERLAVYADRVVALPRPGLRRDLGELLGLDADPATSPIAVIPEGVDTALLDRAEARRRVTNPPTHSPAVAAVRAALPADRRDRPWLLTVGRLHPLKGPHRLAAAWADDPDLANRFNLIIVGGDLAEPSPTERATLDLIAAAATSTGLVRAGQVPPEGVADLLVYAAANNGVYVAASDKEEFGLAIVEALGAGLVVVAPERGGASTYIDQGVNGLVTDTRSVTALRDAIHAAADLAPNFQRRTDARSFVRDQLSVATMAERLGDLYAELFEPDHQLVGTRR